MIAKRSLRSLASLFCILAVVLTGCSADIAKRTILSVNTVQDSLAHAYEAAKVDESTAGADCKTKAAGAGEELPPVLPATIDELRRKCASLGAPIPYDPYKLAKLAGPINATYDAVRAANSLRLAVDAGSANQTQLAAALLDAINRLLDLYVDVKGVGIVVPPEQVKAIESLKNEVSK